MPAHSNYIESKGYDAEGAIGKARAVKAGATAEGCVQCTAAGENGIGISEFGVTTTEIAQGKGATVAVLGDAVWEAGGVIAREADVTTDNQGRCVAAASGNRVWGKAIIASSGAGIFITVRLNGQKTILV